MSKGVLIFAQNNTEIDYAKIALYAALRVKKYLRVPISLATDSKDWLLDSQPTAGDVFDKIITTTVETDQIKRFHDGTLSSRTLTWKNLNRADCFDLTPYDETIVIDSDYLISNSNLNSIWNNKQDFLIYNDSFDLAQWRDQSSFQYLNQWSIPFYWATVFYFKKTNAVENFFELIKYIKANWSYFRSLYSIESSTFRNDFAFSIALHIFGKEFYGKLPGKINYVLDRDLLIAINENELKFLVEKKNYPGEYIATKTKDLDVHVMNKYSLTRCIDKVLV